MVSSLSAALASPSRARKLATWCMVPPRKAPVKIHRSGAKNFLTLDLNTAAFSPLKDSK